MRIRVEKGLLYITVVLAYQDRNLVLDKVILDTGSAGSVFHIEKVAMIGIYPEAEDTIHRIRGVGGEEFASPTRGSRRE